MGVEFTRFRPAWKMSEKVVTVPCKGFVIPTVGFFRLHHRSGYRPGVHPCWRYQGYRHLKRPDLSCGPSQSLLSGFPSAGISKIGLGMTSYGGECCAKVWSSFIE